MPTYVVATRREAQASSSTAEDFVRQVPGVWVKGGIDLNRITIDASELAAAEIERRFGSVLLIEPEIRSQDQGLKALLASAPLQDVELDRPSDFGRDLIESGLASDAEAQRALWLEKNKDAIEAHNSMIERDGLPLDEFRRF